MSSTPGTLRVAPAKRNAVIAKRAAGESKRKIAKDLGIHRETVDNVIEAFAVDQLDHAETIHNKLVPLALARVQQVLPDDTDTAKWLLGNTVFREGGTVRAGRDVVLAGTVNLLPTAGASTTSSPVSTSTPAAESQPIQAAAKAGGGQTSVSLHTNFSGPSTNFSPSGDVIDAEVIEPEIVNSDIEVPE